MWLESLAERCGGSFAEQHGIRSRADVIQVEPVSDRKVATYLSPVAVPAALPPAGPAALGPPPKSWLCETCYWAWSLDVPFCGVCGHSRAATGAGREVGGWPQSASHAGLVIGDGYRSARSLTGWPVTEATVWKSWSSHRTMRPSRSAVAAMSRSTGPAERCLPV